ncbi:hypothetical protein CTI12_AA031440 [Artemisia annua]|uniref:Uncharacterized protein n=1 Tax=Artemisia annua TaxID=35608 RepID=A0A2U1QA90_ARTAN|nr:hypothetical protein CTI12_AA031440 [Artemisia annua]
MSNSNDRKPLEIESAQASPTTIPTDEASDDCIAEVNEIPHDVDESDDPTIGFLLDCVERGENRGNQRPPSICKVSRILRDHNESSYEPQLVSIGPIHRENKKLQEFKLRKKDYYQGLLNRCGVSKRKLEACLLKVNTLIPRIRESYAGMIENYNDDKIVTMMVMDGCFILEFCFKHEEENLYLPIKIENLRVAMDLMLLENQVPFFVLQALFDCFLTEVSFTLSKLLDVCLAPYVELFSLPSSVDSNFSVIDVDSDSTDHKHLLGYMHKRYQLAAAKSSNPNHGEASIPPIKNAVEVDRSWVKFKPHQEDVWSMIIKFQSSSLPWFWSKPNLLMPKLVMQDRTELILRNFIAYEQLILHNSYYFTSYAVAMDELIDSQQDIAKLVNSRVLVNLLGSDQEAADMINKICKNVIIADFCYSEVFKQMDTYCNRFWPKHMAFLRRVYFSNPWTAIALLAAFILFGLTMTQTIFTIKAA